MAHALNYGSFFAAESTWDYTADQGIARRYLVARSDNHAKWGLAVGGLLVPVAITLFFSIGILLYVFYQSNPASAFDQFLMMALRLSRKTCRIFLILGMVLAKIALVLALPIAKKCLKACAVASA